MSEERFDLRAPTGTKDVTWPESHRWEQLLAAFAAQAEAAGFGLLVSPMFEDVRLFRRGIGESTEVVGKEMYEFVDRGGRPMALRPEGTASVVRAFLQHHPPVPWKAWYATPAFRYERPQAGRYRQHHQLGVEALGIEDPDVDVEVIVLAQGFVSGLGIKELSVQLNSMGDATCRPAYLRLLSEALEKRSDELCDEHKERYKVNPLRVLDCKDPRCQEVTASVPVLADHLCEACASHLARVQEGLGAAGVPFVRNDRLVRGLDYYTRTTFELTALALQASQNAVGGGGRYDGLVEALGGPPTPGIGFGVGVERLLLACDREGVFAAPPPPLDAFVVDVTGGEAARDLCVELRRAGLSAERAYGGRSMKAQLRQADRSGALVALIVGPGELEADAVSLRPLRGEADDQRQVARPQVVATLVARGVAR